MVGFASASLTRLLRSTVETAFPSVIVNCVPLSSKVWINSLVASASESFTLKVAAFPLEMLMVTLLPLRFTLKVCNSFVGFESASLLTGLKSIDFVPPASSICKVLPTNLMAWFTSFRGLASASLIRSERSTHKVPPASVILSLLVRGS